MYKDPDCLLSLALILEITSIGACVLLFNLSSCICTMTISICSDFTSEDQIVHENPLSFSLLVLELTSIV